MTAKRPGSTRRLHAHLPASVFEARTFLIERNWAAKARGASRMPTMADDDATAPTWSNADSYSSWSPRSPRLLSFIFLVIVLPSWLGAFLLNATPKVKPSPSTAGQHHLRPPLNRTRASPRPTTKSTKQPVGIAADNSDILLPGIHLHIEPKSKHKNMNKPPRLTTTAQKEDSLSERGVRGSPLNS